MSLPVPCSSTKYDAAVVSAVDEFWRDFREPVWWLSQLCQESHLKPDAVSPVGAQGLAQIMPGTYRDIVRELKWDARVTAFDPERAIRAGAYYQGRMRRMWRPQGRTGVDRNDLGLASYNAGAGNILKSQRICGDAVLWLDIGSCLSMVTGHHSKETITYVRNIHRWSGDLMAARRPR